MLHLAALNGMDSTVELLLQKKADIEAKNKEGSGPRQLERTHVGKNGDLTKVPISCKSPWYGSHHGSVDHARDILQRTPCIMHRIFIHETSCT